MAQFGHPLHLRCGDDLRDRLSRAGIAGEYLCFADPVCQGPAQDDGDLAAWLARRARFVAAHSGADEPAIRRRLESEYAALRGDLGGGTKPFGYGSSTMCGIRSP